MAVKKARKTTKIVKKTKTSSVKKTAVPQKRKSVILETIDYLKLGESYTSLVLGIIAVIIATLVMLSFIHNNQSDRMTPEVTPTIAQSQAFPISPTGVAIKAPQATKMPEITPSAVKPQPAGVSTYTVVAGDNLWVIAEKVYKDGYKWGDIARVNDLTDPSDIHAGNKLFIPSTKQDVPTVQTPDEHLSRSQQTSIINENYTVVPGDNLWGIALRAYGDGYRWVDIAKANNLSNPDVIHTGNILKLPR